MRLTCACMVLSTMLFLRRRRRRLRDFSCIPWLPPAFERFTRPDPVTRKRLDAALFVFIFGMTPPSLPSRTGRRCLSRRSDGFESLPERGAEDDDKWPDCQAGGGAAGR